jgi:Peptidase of plants and bacteria
MTKRQLMTHFWRVVAAYVPGIANRTGLPAREFKMVWSTSTAVAATANGVIYLNYDNWFKDHPDDYGALVHEYTHLIQDVPGDTCPGDVIEGAADAMRYIFGLFDPSWWSPTPTAAKIAGLSYAAFQRLSQAMHAGTYDPSLLNG